MFICYFHYNEIEKEKFGCIECESECKEKDNFCNICGNKLEKYIIKEKEKEKSVNHWDLLEGTFMDTGGIVHNDFDILICARKKVEGRYFDIEDDSELQEISPANIIGEVEWLKKEYKKEIEILQKNYDKVEVKWGMVKRLY